MRYLSYTLLTLFLLPLFLGCSTKVEQPTTVLPKPEEPKQQQHVLEPVTFQSLRKWNEQDFDAMLELFVYNCQAQKAQTLFEEQCEMAEQVIDARLFFETHFTPYKIITDEKKSGMATGYYEPMLYGSLTKSQRFKYPVYGVPNDLIEVDLGSFNKELKNKRIKGRVVGNKLVPYYKRSQISNADAEPICYVDDRIDLFFLEIQGSGRVFLDNGEMLFVGYAGQNGHPYRAIGRYLIKKGEIARKNISMQSIRTWLMENRHRQDEVFNYNPSYVFFQVRNQPATGSLGLVLTPRHSVAVDPRYIPLGSMLYMQTRDPVDENEINAFVFAQDTGGAIKGELRADYFWGYGKEASQRAGLMKEDLQLWMLLPNTQEPQQSIQASAGVGE